MTACKSFYTLPRYAGSLFSSLPQESQQHHESERQNRKKYNLFFTTGDSLLPDISYRQLGKTDT